MDRTLDSDSSNAGSIPAGRIFFVTIRYYVKERYGR